jgi:O-antigen/teichoic acid export membrane protein
LGDAPEPTALNTARRLVGDTVLYGSALAVSRAVTFLMLPFYTRFLGAVEFGAFDIAMSLNRALFVPAALGLDSGVALALQGRDPSAQKQAAASALAALLSSVCLVALVTVLLSRAISARIVGDADRAMLVTTAAVLLLPTVVNNFTSNLLKWKREPRGYIALVIGSIALSAALSVWLVLAGVGATGAVLGMLLGGALFIPVGFLLCRRHLWARPRLEDVRLVVRMGLPFAAVGAGELVFPFLLRTIVATQLGLSAVGVFGAANAICLSVMLINDSFSTAWGVHMLAGERDLHLRADALKIMRLYALLLVGFIGALALSADLVVPTIVGTGPIGQAAGVIVPLALAYWFKSVRQNSSIGLIVARRVWLRAALNFATLLASAAFAWPLIRQFGVIGAALAFAIGEAIGLALQELATRRIGGFQAIDARAIAIMAASFIVLAICLNTLVPVSLGWSIVARSMLGVAFVAALVLTGVAPPRELARAVALLRRSEKPALRGR